MASYWNAKRLFQIYNPIQLLSFAAWVNGNRFCFPWDLGFVLLYLFFFLSFMKVTESRYLKWCTMKIQDHWSSSSPARFTVYTFDSYPSLQIRKGKLILLLKGFCETSISERLASSREMSKGVLATEEGKDITSHVRTEACFRKRGGTEGGREETKDPKEQIWGRRGQTSEVHPQVNFV